MSGRDVDPLIQQLTAHRRRQRLSQRRVAEAMGTVQSAVSEIETGIVAPTLPVLRRYAGVVGFYLSLEEHA